MLVSADRFRDAAICFGSFSVKTPCSRSSAFDCSVTAGVVSALKRDDLGITDFEDFIQTDAYLNRGNSGGPLLNLRGEVVGMNSMIRASGTSNEYTGIGFAIPARMLQTISGQLIERGRVVRGWLGIRYRIMDSGIRISEVVEGSPAAMGGIERRDVIQAINSQPVGEIKDFPWVIANLTAGSVVRFSVLRGSAPMELDVTIGEMPPQYAGMEEKPRESDAPLLARWGATGLTLAPGLAESHGFQPEDRGVFVTRVAPESPASEAGLRLGDLVTALNGNKIETLEDWERLLGEAVRKGDAQATLALARGEEMAQLLQFSGLARRPVLG